MLLDHPPHIITRGREHGPPGCFEGLTPVQVPMVVQACVAYDAEVQEALADTLAVIQAMAQARPHAFPRVPVHTCTVRVTTSLRARTMVDRPMVIVGLGTRVTVVVIGQALRPALHLSDAERFERCGAHLLPYCQRDLRGWRVLVGCVAALHQAQQGWTACLSRSATAPLHPALSGGAVVAFACTGPPLTARTLVARVRHCLQGHRPSFPYNASSSALAAWQATESIHLIADSAGHYRALPGNESALTRFLVHWGKRWTTL